MPSKTQLAFERRDLTALTRIGVRKCFDLHPPISTDHGAENVTHAHKRYRTNRYAWIEKWIAWELAHPREGDTGSRMMTRLRWRMLDAIRDEYAARKRRLRDPRDTRNRREKLPPRDVLIAMLSTLAPPTDPVLLDLWERIVDAYPDWRPATNRHLAVVCGVHHNVMASRRRALALLMHQQASGPQEHLLVYGLRLRIGALRKKEIGRLGVGNLKRSDLTTEPEPIKHIQLTNWSDGTRQMEPVFAPTRPDFLRPPRCTHVYSDGRHCVYSQDRCPNHNNVV